MMFTRDLWDSLSHSPGWAAMKQFLVDHREKLKEQIAEGALNPSDTQQAIVRCQNIKDLAEMDWETIRKFYEPPEDKIKFVATEMVRRHGPDSTAQRNPVGY